jgi:hypothetical protein
MTDQPRTLTFTLALTVCDPHSQAADDVLVHGAADQSVGELAVGLAAFFGHPHVDAAGQPLGYGLRVERTGEQLRPTAPIGSVDLLEGDIVGLLVPRQAERRRPRWAEPETDAAGPDELATRIIPLRPRRPRP